MRVRDKVKQLSYQRAHYERNKQERLSLNRKRIKETLTMLNEIKSAGCTLCPEKEIVCLDFHHVNPKTKDKSLAVAARSGWSKKRILLEVSKCVVVCSNCHRKIEAGIIENPSVA